jgi:DNA-binding transcriptional LysR family regulator
MQLACPPDHPLARRRRIALAELDGEHFVDYPQGWGTRLSVDELFAEAGLHREIVVEVGDIPTVVDLVRAGFGFAFVSPSTVPNPERLVLQHVRPYPEFTVSVLWSTARPLSAAGRAFRDLVEATDFQR